VRSTLERQTPAAAGAATALAPPSAPVGRLQRAPVRPRRFPGLADPIAVGLIAVVIYALHGYDGELSRDLGVFTYGGEQLTHGVPPYVGVFNSVGPLADAVPGLAAWWGHLVGVAPVLSMRVFFTCLSALCCALLCVLARDTFGSRAAGLVAPAVFVSFERFLALSSDGPREKTTMVVFMLAMLILAGRQRWMAAGVFTALGTLTWQPVLLVGLGVVAVGAVCGGRNRGSILVRFLVGGAIPSVVTVLWYVLEGALKQALDGFIVVNVAYTSQPSALTQPGLIWSKLWDSYHATLLVAIVGLVLMLTLAAAAVPAVRRSAGVFSPVPYRLTSIGGGCLAGTLWTVSVINGGPDLFVLLPFAALGVAGVVILLANRLPRRLGPVLVATAACIGVGAAGVESVTTRQDTLLVQRADVNAVLATQPSDATILSIETPQVPAIADRTDIWPWQLFDHRMLTFLDHTQPGGLGALTARLAADRPTFVVIANRYQGVWQQGVVARDYWQVGAGPGWSWYLSRTAGQAALARARAANSAAMVSAPA
jgi:hypothetical protein